MKTRILYLLMILCFSFSFGVSLAQAQEDEELKISLNRDFGFSLGSQIQGTFTIRVTGPQNLERVDFLIDSKRIGEAAVPPFQIRFDTGSYEIGTHTIGAIGYTRTGQELHSELIRVEFVSPDRGWQTALKILLPIAVVIFGAILLSAVIPFLLGRPRQVDLPLGAPRSYGLVGGAICPKCSRPFGMHLYGLNLIVGKFDRCPYCGRWSLVRRASPGELVAAEAAELEMAAGESQVMPLSEEEKLRKSLEDSRFQDL